MSERAVFLSRLEFSIMLIAGGIEEIACFPLPGAKEVDERQMITVWCRKACLRWKRME